MITPTERNFYRIINGAGKHLLKVLVNEKKEVVPYNKALLEMFTGTMQVAYQLVPKNKQAFDQGGEVYESPLDAANAVLDGVWFAKKTST